MSNIQLALEGAWRVLVASLLLGAGLPTLFAAGVRALAYGNAATSRAARLIGLVLAGLCFLVVVAGVGLGIAYIIAFGFGYDIAFDQAVPTLKRKG